jgi:ferric-dicitrate binding protein FerR (iron transport regulator)
MNYVITEYIINFLARKESPEDVQKLKEWLATDSAHRDELKQWFVTWDAVNMADAGKLHPEEAYQRFMFRLQREASTEIARRKNRIRNMVKTISRIASVFLVSFLLGILCHFYWVNKQPPKLAFIENIVPLGSKSEVNLPDGSVVWLNAGSTLRYSTDYGRTTRDVYLTGEGYFKVAKQDKAAFTVHTSLMKVKALGTEFNVKAYPDEDKTEATLVSGKVSIEKVEENISIDRPIVLESGQKFSVRAIPNNNKTDETEQPQAEPTNHKAILPQLTVKQLSSTTIRAEVSWKERNWRIESEQLQDLAVKLNRRYDVHILMDEQLKNYRFTGTIKDESLEQVLHAMQLTAPILFKVEGKIVSIYIDPQKIK